MTFQIHLVEAIESAAPALTAIDPAWTRLLGRLHPMVVHFPIALVLLAALLESLRILARRRTVSRTAVTCLAFGAVLAALAAWFGWINAEQESHGRGVADTILLHRWIGVAAAVLPWLALGSAALHRARDSMRMLAWYRGTLLFSALLVSLGGHLGAELVYGRGYLLAVFRSEADPVVVVAALPIDGHREPGGTAIAFDTHVRPIFEAHCVSCHGPRRQRGGLRLDAIGGAIGGPAPLIIPGEPDASPVLQRVRLPVDDPDHMPADGETVPASQIDVIARWIAEGAVLGAGHREPDAAIDESTTNGAAPPPARRPPIDEATRLRRDHAIDAIVARGGLARVLAADTDDVDVNLSLSTPPILARDLALLEGLEDSLVWLNVARSGITDGGLEHLTRFRMIRRLRLDRTAITGAGVAHLAALTELTHLNLVGTPVGDDALGTIASLQHLEIVYLWQTNVTDDGVADLRARRPGLQVVRGATPPPAAPPGHDAGS